MPTAAAATYVRTVLFRRRHSSSCARVNGFVPFGRRGGCTARARARAPAGLGRLHVPSRLSPVSAPPVPLLPGRRHRSARSATPAGGPRGRQRQQQTATRLHAGRQSPPIAPERTPARHARGQISRGLRALARPALSPPLPGLPGSSGRRLRSPGSYGGRVARIR